MARLSPTRPSTGTHRAQRAAYRARVSTNPLDPRRGRLAAIALAATALLALAGCGSSPHPAAAAAAATTAAASPTASPTPSPTPTASPTPVPPPSPTPAWTKCDAMRDEYQGGCSTDFNRDSCDASEYSSEWGSLLDAMIENKIMVNPDRLKDCPQFLPTWKQAQTGFGEGVQIVGTDVQPGRYQTTAHLSGGRVTDCYWERSRDGHIVANDFVSGASKVTVTIYKGDDAFTSHGCGDWVRIG